MIASITRENPGVVTVLDDHRHGLESGDVVVINEVEGMEEVSCLFSYKYICIMSGVYV